MFLTLSLGFAGPLFADDCDGTTVNYSRPCGAWNPPGVGPEIQGPCVPNNGTCSGFIVVDLPLDKFSCNPPEPSKKGIWQCYLQTQSSPLGPVPVFGICMTYQVCIPNAEGSGCVRSADINEVRPLYDDLVCGPGGGGPGGEG